MKQYWAIPSEYSAEFVAPMEDVLAVYQHPYDPAYPDFDQQAKRRTLKT